MTVIALLVSIAATTAAQAQPKPPAAPPMPQTRPPGLPASMPFPPAPAKPATAASGPTLNLRPGLWEISNVNATPGSNATRTVTSRTCYSADDVHSAQRLLPRQGDFGMKCETKDVKSQGAEVTWKISCSGKERSFAGSAKMTLAGDSYTATSSLDNKESKAGAKATKLEQTITGKRVGDCK